MPEEIQDSQVQENPIYKFMKSNNLTKLDEKAFLNTYSKPEKAKEIHSFMVSNDLTKLDESKFYDSYLKKKDQTLPSGEISSLTELPSSFIEPLKKGVAPSKNIGEERAMRQLGVRPYAGVTIPTNLPKQDALRYEKELKVQDAAINTLTDVYKQKGLKFDPLKPAAQKQIQDYIDKEKNNDLGLVEGIKDKKLYLTRTTGLGETLYSTAIESFKEPIKSIKINTIANPKEFADFADEEIKNTPNVPESVPSNIGGYLGQLGGALPKLVAEEAVGGPALVAAEMYWNGIANQRKALYQKGLDQGMDRIQAAQMAMDNATTSAIPDFIVGAILTVGVKGHTGILKQGTADAFKDAMKNVVKSSPKMFAVGAGAEFGRAETQKQAGYKVDRTEEVENMFRGGGDLAKMDAAFKTAMAAPYVPKILYAAAKNVLSETPKPVLDALAQKYGDNGKVIDDVSKFAETKAEVQDLVPEAKVASVTGLTQKVKNIQKDIDELTARREKTTDALKPQIDSWIKAYQDEINFYNKQINKVVESKDPTGVTEEVDDITGQKIGTKQYVVDGKEVSQQEFEAMQDKPIGTKEVIKAEPEEVKVTEEVKPTEVKVKEYKEKSVQKENERAKYLGFDTIAKDTLNDINEVLNENYENLYEVNSVAAYKAKKLINQSNKIKEKVVTPELKNITPKNIEDKLRNIEFEVTDNEGVKDIHHGSDVYDTGGGKILINDKAYTQYGIQGRNENNYFGFIINDKGDIQPVYAHEISDLKIKQLPQSEIDVKDTAKKLKDIADSREKNNKRDEKTFQLYNDVENLVGKGRNGFDYTKNKWEDVSKFYHKALKDGSNPELVKIVDDYLEGTYIPKEPKVYNAKDLKENPKILNEDEGFSTSTNPRSFVTLSTNMLALKSAGYEKAKIGDIINVFKKDYVIRDFGEEKKNPDNKIVSLIRVDKDGNILRERDLSAKESKAGMAKEFEEEEELEVEKPELSKDDIKKAEAKFAVAEDRFKKARNKIEATQVKQAGMFGGEQKGMFAMGGEEAKSTLDPLRKAAKEAKAELDNIRNKIKVKEQAQTELTSVEEEPRGYYKGVYKGKRMKFVKPIEKTYEGEKVTEGNIKQKAKDKYIQLTDDEGVIRNYSGKIKDASFKRNGKQVFSIESKENDSILSFIINDKGEIEMDGSGGNIYKIKLTTELETETLPVINANIEKLRNDRDFGIQDQPESFVEKWVPFNELKENNLKEGNIVNFEGKKYLVERISENNNGKKTKAHLFEIGKDGNLLREVDIRPYQQALKEKQEAEKRLTRQVGAEKANVTKEIYRRVSQTERQLGSGEEGAQEIALRYLADGGKVSKAAVDEAYGSAKRAQLNVKRREFLSEEVKSKDFVQGNEKLDDLAHRLWQDNKQKISEIDIKDKLMAEIGNNNSRLEAAEVYLDNYNAEYKQEKEEIRMAEEYKAEYLEEQEKLEKELREPLKQQIEGEASEEHVNNLIDQYESEIKGEDQQFGPESEGEVNKEAGKRKVSEKIEEKSVEETYKDLTIIEKRQIINSKFDELLKELKIEKICPTD
jgi:hypothetical protein